MFCLKNNCHKNNYIYMKPYLEKKNIKKFSIKEKSIMVVNFITKKLNYPA